MRRRSLLASVFDRRLLPGGGGLGAGSGRHLVSAGRRRLAFRVAAVRRADERHHGDDFGADPQPPAAGGGVGGGQQGRPRGRKDGWGWFADILIVGRFVTLASDAALAGTATYGQVSYWLCNLRDARDQLVA